MIKPICDFCKKELQDFGAILLSPPDNDNKVRKFHICKECFKKLNVENRGSDEVKKLLLFMVGILIVYPILNLLYFFRRKRWWRPHRITIKDIFQGVFLNVRKNLI